MAKKTETPTVKSSKLIIERDEFRNQINDRISKGKELLNFPVRIISNKVDTRGKLMGVYDKTEESAFLSEYKKWKQFNIELLKRYFNNPENEYLQEYENTEHTVWSDWVIERKQDVERQITVLESLLERLFLIPTIETTKDEMKIKAESTNKVFIVHGHNNEIKQIIARTLSQLKLEPIILHEKAEQGRTIIEKFEQNSSDVNFAIILLTADDEGKAKAEVDYKARARQNVVFEMGYFIGKLGREKVFLLLENGVDKPGDLDGIVYVPIDAAEGWKLKLVRELKAAGYNVTADDL